MAKKTCPGIISPMGHPMVVAVVRKTIKPSPIHSDLYEIEYLDGWRKHLNITRGAKKVSLYKHTVFLFPHGNEKCLAFPESTEAVLQITDRAFPRLFSEVQRATEEKWDAIGKQSKAEKKIVEMAGIIEELQKKLALK